MGRLLFLPAAALLAACAGESHRDVVVGPPRVVELVVPGAAQLRIALPPGDALVEGKRGDALQATLEIRCASAQGACAERAEQVRWVVESSAALVSLRADPDSLRAYRDAQTTMRLSVPDDRPVQINMSAGDLTVRRVSGCLAVQMNAGDVNVEVPAASVRTVHLDANFGDTSLAVGGDAIEGRSSRLVGAEVEWHDGAGECSLAIDLNIGDVSVSLY